MAPIYDIHSELATLKSEISHLRKDVNKVLDLLIENPTHSISPRTTILESETKHFWEAFKKLDNQAWQLKVAIFTSLIGLAGSILVVIFEISAKSK